MKDAFVKIWEKFGQRFWRPIAGGLVILTLLAGVHWSRLSHGNLVLDFLDIGQGDAILITTPNNERILIDGGPEQIVLEELGEVLPFMNKRIDLMILTHPHADHMMGLVQVLKRHEVEMVLFSGANYWSPIYDEFLKEIRERKIPLKIARADEDFEFGGDGGSDEGVGKSGEVGGSGEIVLDVIYPFESMMGQTLSNVNNASVVMMLEYGDHRILLPGDAEIEVEEALVAAHDRGEINLKADILKSGHHGSRTASSWEFLKRVDPEMVMIQSGAENDYGHPHEETLSNYAKMGIEVRRNDLEGRVRIRLE